MDKQTDKETGRAKTLPCGQTSDHTSDISAASRRCDPGNVCVDWRAVRSSAHSDHIQMAWRPCETLDAPAAAMCHSCSDRIHWDDGTSCYLAQGSPSFV